MLNWLFFYTWAILLGILIYVPGIVWFSNLKVKPYLIVALAPTFSFLVLTVLMTTASHVAFKIHWYHYVLFLIMMTILGFYLHHKELMNLLCIYKRNTYSSLFFYLVVSIALTSWIYVKNLDGPSSFIPLYDNACTLSTIHAFSKADIYGPFFSSVYYDSPQLFDGVSYYPALFHSIAAFAANMFKCDAAEALNIVVFDTIFILIPVSVRSLVKATFPNNHDAEFMGAFSPFVFYAFPWNLLLFGSLYAYLFSLAFVPAVLASLIELLQNRESRNLYTAGLCFAGLIVTALCHPGAVFSIGTISIPFLIKIVVDKVPKGRYSCTYKLLLALLTFSLIAGIWFLFYKMPYLNSIVSFNWPAIMTPSEALSSVMGLSFTDSPSQPILVAVILVGVLSCIRRLERSSWLIASAMLVSFIYYIDVSTDGSIKHLVSGFWYTDSRRIAAMLVLVLMPIFSYGLGNIYRLVVNNVAVMKDSKVKPTLMGSIIASVFLFLSLGPSINLYGSFGIPSSISFARKSLAAYNQLEPRTLRSGELEGVMIDGDELEAGRDIAHLTSDGGTVLNNTLDGSAFYYSLFDVNTLFRTCGAGEAGGPYEDLRRYAADYTSAPHIRELIKKADIRYVLVLDFQDNDSAKNTFLRSFNSSDWAGIQDITQDTPGFQQIYSKGDIRLYRLTDI